MCMARGQRAVCVQAHIQGRKLQCAVVKLDGGLILLGVHGLVTACTKAVCLDRVELLGPARPTRICCFLG